MTELLPEKPEALGLLALMLHAEARRRARRSAGGRVRAARRAGPGAVGLADDRRGRGAAAARQRAGLDRPLSAGSARCSRRTSIAAARVSANWAEVVQLYDALLALTGSPVVAINRALAIAEMHGAGAALDAMQELAADARLAEYQPYWAARAELLATTGARDEARARLRDRDRSRARSGGPPLPAGPPASSVVVRGAGTRACCVDTHVDAKRPDPCPLRTSLPRLRDNSAQVFRR